MWIPEQIAKNILSEFSALVSEQSINIWLDWDETWKI